jgi:hypothetical protein
MCLILIREPNVNLPYDSLKNAVTNNPHGWGYVIPDRGKLEIRRHFDEKGTDPEEVMDVLENYMDKRIFLHLRFCTAGDRSKHNVHPFPALSKRKDGMQVWVMHNGTMSAYRKAQSTYSDTFHFTNEVINPLLKRVMNYTGKTGLLKDPFVGTVLEKFIDGWSKFVLVDNYGNYTTVGDGVQQPGYWLSNDYSFKPEYRKPAVTTTTPKTFSYKPGHKTTQNVIDAEYEDVYKGRCMPPFSTSTDNICTNDNKEKLSNQVTPLKVSEPQAPLDLEDRVKFSELLGLQSIDDLYGLTESDILDLVTEYPEVMTVLIQDLLYERKLWQDMQEAA